jgi:hypothetical protein
VSLFLAAYGTSIWADVGDDILGSGLAGMEGTYMVFIHSIGSWMSRAMLLPCKSKVFSASRKLINLGDISTSMVDMTERSLMTISMT